MYKQELNAGTVTGQSSEGVAAGLALWVGAFPGGTGHSWDLMDGWMDADAGRTDHIQMRKPKGLWRPECAGGAAVRLGRSLEERSLVMGSLKHQASSAVVKESEVKGFTHLTYPLLELQSQMSPPGPCTGILPLVGSFLKPQGQELDLGDELWMRSRRTSQDSSPVRTVRMAAARWWGCWQWRRPWAVGDLCAFSLK